MADDLIDFGDQGQQNDAFGVQPIDQIGFVGTHESGLVHLPNLRPIARTLLPDSGCELASHSSTNRALQKARS